MLILSQSITATATTLPVLCAAVSLSLTTTVTLPPSLMELPVTSGQHHVVLLPLLMPWYIGVVVGLATIPQQQPQSQMPPQAYANYAMGPPQLSFSFRANLPFDLFIYVGVCCGVCFLLSGAILDAIFFTKGGSNIRFCISAALQSITMAGIFASWWWSSANARNAPSGCSIHCFE